ncbi:MAG TPA: Ada metal-binding domain-containing protein, partial [Burkholderiales bacterium]|nr:Ada metal-binding domain-containing protein [Burkholderiales bacterium]
MKTRAFSTPTVITHDPRWAAVRARNKEADGQFVYSVRSTGVYCRPSCPARLAKPENVSFHRSCAEAETAGFRPCKRCKPNSLTAHKGHAEKIESACRILEASESLPTLETLAQQVGLSASHFHRLFKQSMGLTPAEYARRQREERLRQHLRRSGSITDAIFDAGYASNSRFYERADAVLGMKAQNYRKGGAETEIRFAVGQCSLGAILVAQSERGICAISLGDDPDALLRSLQNDFPRATLVGGDRKFEQWMAKIVGFVEAPHLGL